jgi:hypothetical protein
MPNVAFLFYFGLLRDMILSFVHKAVEHPPNQFFKDGLPERGGLLAEVVSVEKISFFFRRPLEICNDAFWMASFMSDSLFVVVAYTKSAAAYLTSLAVVSSCGNFRAT